MSKPISIDTKIETKSISVTGKTKRGSHVEKDKCGQDVTVNDYDFATVKVNIPANNADSVEFYGLERLCNLAQAHEIVLLGNLIRGTLGESKGLPQDEKNAIAQKAIGNDYPKCLDARIKVPGAPRVSAKVKRAMEERQTALTYNEKILEKPYDKWKPTTQQLFNETYPIPVSK